MFKGRRCRWAATAICLGTLILLGILLPGQFWWLLLAGGLIAFGVWLLRCC
ncbi:MAG: hypothetical protein K6G17_06005 [Oscillospiraceae bacterium]|nr:hypothetical protein [Oscillospiraceae bacterium]